MADWIHAGNAEEIKEAGVKQLSGGLVVFAHEGDFYAIENRCPHMGFPLHMGSLCDGILTCHWHHARFDVCSGGTLDPWADDVSAHDIRIDDGEVFVHTVPKFKKGIQEHFDRLREGLEQNLSLIIAKSVVALVQAGVNETDIAAVGLTFGTSQRMNGWGSGLTILTAMVNILPKLDAYGRILALCHGLVHVAQDCAGRPPRHLLKPLPETVDVNRLMAWYRQCAEVRDTQGAERVLLAAVQQGTDKKTLADMVLIAVTDHFYLDGGHTFDFHNKAFEALSVLREEASSAQVLSSLVPLLGNPSRSEEQQNWRSPVDLVTPLHDAFTKLGLSQTSLSGIGHDQPNVFGQGREKSKREISFDSNQFVQTILGDDPHRAVEAITSALQAGVNPAQIAQLVTLAAANRIVHFHVQNDFGDWIAVLHTFTHAHAVHQSIGKGAHPAVIRAIYHTAMRIYLDRFLNVPKAAKPHADRAQEQEYTSDLAEFLSILDGRQKVADAADWVALYLREGGKVAPLLNTLGHALLREDAEFHSFQMVEAAFQEYDQWSNTESPIRVEAQHTLLFATARYLAAHAPTARELPHVVRIAWRLGRGEKLYEE